MVSVDLSNVHIEGVTVNHNTSLYMELMLRSLLAKHSSGPSLSLTVFDNASQDEMGDLYAYSEEAGIPILQSGFNTETENNSHGEMWEATKHLEEAKAGRRDALLNKLRMGYEGSR